LKLNRPLNILICPLEWGLGHAARMIPLARSLKMLNNNVLFGAGDEHLALFRKETPDIKCIRFPGFKPGYSRFLPQYLWMLLKTPFLLFHIIREHKKLKKIVRDHSIDIVISDNRFGLWNRTVRTVYITHMPVIPLPQPLHFLEFAGVLLHRWIIKKYDFCFIPDLPGGTNLSGRLSHGVRLPSNVRFIGILSRFRDVESGPVVKTIDGIYNAVILSGPEPQRSILRKKLSVALEKHENRTLFLGGKPDTETEPEHSGKITFINHLQASAMKEVLEKSNSIISRSGYTTIMELISLNRGALLIPTPGQTEQEYLARYLEERGWFRWMPQNKISSAITLTSEKPVWTEEMMNESKLLLEKALEELLGKDQQESRDNHSE
jgi:spore coat polysaccharide biosynthesis predicted glycosyltransferase SpsG